MAATLATVPASTTAVTLKAANALRQDLVVINDANMALLITDGAGGSVRLPARSADHRTVIATSVIRPHFSKNPTATITGQWVPSPGGPAAPTGSAYVIEVT